MWSFQSESQVFVKVVEFFLSLRRLAAQKYTALSEGFRTCRDEGLKPVPLTLYKFLNLSSTATLVNLVYPTRAMSVCPMVLLYHRIMLKFVSECLQLISTSSTGSLTTTSLGLWWTICLDRSVGKCRNVNLLPLFAST